MSSRDTVNGGEKSSQAMSAAGDARTMHGFRFLCRSGLKRQRSFPRTRKMQTCRCTSSQRPSDREDMTHECSESNLPLLYASAPDAVKKKDGHDSIFAMRLFLKPYESRRCLVYHNLLKSWAYGIRLNLKLSGLYRKTRVRLDKIVMLL